MQKVLQCPLGPLPWALANCNGILKNTSMAALAHNLEKRLLPANRIPTPSTCIIGWIGSSSQIECWKGEVCRIGLDYLQLGPQRRNR